MEGIKVIIYNDKDITYKEGYLVNIKSSPNIIETYSLSEEPKQIIDGHTETIECYVDGEKQSIELDPTTMKRILKYNKEVEIEKLNKEIKSKQEEIKQLDDKLQDREGRWQKVKNYIVNIYDIDLNEEDWNDDDDWDD